MRTKRAIGRKTEEKSVIGLYFGNFTICQNPGGAFSSSVRVTVALSSIYIALKRTFSTLAELEDEFAGKFLLSIEDIEIPRTFASKCLVTTSTSSSLNFYRPLLF